ncbi:MAG: helix-turn-helix domain-containing protein [Deferribacteraceae bacterium]|jgi:hypothetical protein|nr:helix-turn-helix domain-containing protein [Deferribacteraceae bacterium]
MSKLTLISLSTAAKQYGLSKRRLLYAIEAGKLKAYNLSQGAMRPRWYVTDDDVVKFLEDQSTFVVKRH